MMNKFKVGDRVRRIKPWPGFVQLPPKELVISALGGEHIKINGFEPEFIDGWWWWKSHFELISDPIEEAKKLLAEKGYTITPPPEKKKGRFYIFSRPSGRPFSVHKDEVTNWYKENYKLLAIVPWEEGQGL